MTPGSTRLAAKAQWSYWMRHPVQFLLTLLIIAVGVASAVGTDVAIEASKKSFLLSLEAGEGRATHRIEANGGIPEEFLKQLRAEHRLHNASPVVAGRVHLQSAPGSGGSVWGDNSAGESLRLLGLDPFIDVVHMQNADTTVFNVTGSSARLLKPGSVAMSSALAQRLGLQPGQSATLVGGKKLEVAVIFTTTQSSLDNLLVCDIATAQELLQQSGHLSYIALQAPEQGLSDWEEQVRSWLPQGYRLIPVGQRAYASLQLADSLFLNLSALSWMAALVGIFLVYQAHSFCLLATRPQLGQMRRLGLTAGEAAWLVVSDGLWLGWLGSLLGCWAGILVSQFLVKLLSTTLDDLYFSMQVQPTGVDGWSLLKGLALGLGSALLAVLPHAREIYRDSPATFALGSRVEESTRRGLRGIFWLGLALLVIGAAALSSDLKLFAHLLAMIALVAGMAAIIPYSAARANTLMTGWLQGRVPLWLALGLRQVQANISRSGVAVAALSLALAGIVAIETMVFSFRITLNEWLEQTLQSDIFIALADHDAMREGSFLPQEFLDKLQESGLVLQGTGTQGLLKGVTSFVLRHIELELEIPRRGQIPSSLLLAVTTTDSQLDTYRLLEEAPQPRARLRAGQVWISQPFARHQRLHIGDVLRMNTPTGLREMPVAGIFVDFSTDQGYVLMDFDLFGKWFAESHITGMTLRLDDPSRIEEVVQNLRRLPGSQTVEIRSNRALKELSRTIFERTFQITKALRWFALAIALVGMSSSLAVLALQKRKERALLRALGMTVLEVRRVHFVHSLMLGWWAGLFAIAAGLIQAFVMVKVIQNTAFGWTLSFHIPPSAWAAPLAAGLCCSVAALLSLAAEGRAEIVSILREE